MWLSIKSPPAAARHRFFIRHLENRLDNQELARQRELGMTQHYMHLSPAALDSAIRLLDQPALCKDFGDVVENGRSLDGKINGWKNLINWR